MPQISDETAFAYVVEIAAELEFVLKTASEKRFTGTNQYCRLGAEYISEAVAGYIHLRRVPFLRASELLIRPMLEVTFYLAAIHGKPDLLFRRGYVEYDEDKKWAKTHDSEDASVALAALETAWGNFKKRMVHEHPAIPFKETPLSVFEAAQKAGAGKIYDAYYRLYCRHTHGMLRAIDGSILVFKDHDNCAVALCCLTVIQTLRSLGLSVPKLDYFESEFTRLGLVS